MNTDNLDALATWSVSQAGQLILSHLELVASRSLSILSCNKGGVRLLGEKPFVLGTNIFQIYVETRGQIHPSEYVHLNSS